MDKPSAAGRNPDDLQPLAIAEEEARKHRPQSTDRPRDQGRLLGSVLSLEEKRKRHNMANAKYRQKKKLELEAARFKWSENPDDLQPLAIAEEEARRHANKMSVRKYRAKKKAEKMMSKGESQRRRYHPQSTDRHRDQGRLLGSDLSLEEKRKRHNMASAKYYRKKKLAKEAARLKLSESETPLDSGKPSTSAQQDQMAKPSAAGRNPDDLQPLAIAEPHVSQAHKDVPEAHARQGQENIPEPRVIGENIRKEDTDVALLQQEQQSQQHQARAKLRDMKESLAKQKLEIDEYERYFKEVDPADYKRSVLIFKETSKKRSYYETTLQNINALEKEIRQEVEDKTVALPQQQDQNQTIAQRKSGFNQENSESPYKTHTSSTQKSDTRTTPYQPAGQPQDDYSARIQTRKNLLSLNEQRRKAQSNLLEMEANAKRFDKNISWTDATSYDYGRAADMYRDMQSSYDTTFQETNALTKQIIQERDMYYNLPSASDNQPTTSAHSSDPAPGTSYQHSGAHHSPPHSSAPHYSQQMIQRPPTGNLQLEHQHMMAEPNASQYASAPSYMQSPQRFQVNQSSMPASTMGDQTHNLRFQGAIPIDRASIPAPVQLPQQPILHSSQQEIPHTRSTKRCTRVPIGKAVHDVMDDMFDKLACSPGKK